MVCQASWRLGEQKREENGCVWLAGPYLENWACKSNTLSLGGELALTLMPVLRFVPGAHL